MRRTIICVYAVLLQYLAYTQSKVNVEFEKIQEQCKGISAEKRTRLAVSRFSVSTPHASSQFGTNMATMLTNALQETNCFRMLEQLGNIEDLKSEIEFGQSENSDGETSLEKGKMMSAQAIITGEVTEYSIQEKKLGIGVFKTTSKTAKIGFILKIINPQSREILFSKSVNVEGKTDGGANVGIGVPWLGRVDLGSGGNTDPAIANALEKGIIEAVQFLASKKDDIIPAPAAGVMSDDKFTTITLTGTTFSDMSALSEALKEAKEVKEIQKTLKDSVGTIKVKHTGTTDDLLATITRKIVNLKLEIAGFSSGKILLRQRITVKPN